jgi:hypothetical protein
MKLTLGESIQLDAPPPLVWDTLADIGNLPLFTGFGPIPGIESARWIRDDACRPGAVREVRNTDGSIHREEVLAASRPERLEDRIFAFDSPFRFIVRQGYDRFDLVPVGNRTELRRTFVFELTSPVWWPLASVIRLLFRSAVRRHHGALRAKLGTAK